MPEEMLMIGKYFHLNNNNTTVKAPLQVISLNLQGNKIKI
jgi:hypothetical protein